ncbi:MAG: hypothetical protein ACRDHZ_01695 [Ktedonobacteraceae bacterium]
MPFEKIFVGVTPTGTFRCRASRPMQTGNVLRLHAVKGNKDLKETLAGWLGSASLAAAFPFVLDISRRSRSAQVFQEGETL